MRFLFILFFITACARVPKDVAEARQQKDDWVSCKKDSECTHIDSFCNFKIAINNQYAKELSNIIKKDFSKRKCSYPVQHFETYGQICKDYRCTLSTTPLKKQKKKPIPGIAPDTVRKVLESGIPEFKKCYEDYNTNFRKYIVEVRLMFNIDRNGKIVDEFLLYDGGKFYHKELHPCIHSKLVGLNFPKPKNRKPVPVSQVIFLYPSS